jgi:cell division protein FtsW (lipid II flippase)
MIKRNRQGKSQVRGFYVHFLKIDFYKLFLNLLVLALLGVIIWSAVKLFSGEFLHSPLIGSLVFFVEIVAFVLLCRHTRANKWRPPSIVVTALVIIAMLVVVAFAGVQPISNYKDKLVSNISTDGNYTNISNWISSMDV